MKMRCGVIFCAILTCLLTAMAEEQSEVASKSHENLGMQLYKILSKQEGNIFFSPLSVHAVLALAYQGAAGETAEAMKNVLNLISPFQVANEYRHIMTSLNSVQNVTLNIANKVYVQQDYKLKSSFKEVATGAFFAEAENINFGDSVNAANKINTWVEGKTHDKIKDLIQPGDLDELTRLVLVNAIYFKGSWLEEFNALLTRTEPFYVSDSHTVDCRMMHITRHFNYGEIQDWDAKILELPYTNEGVSMLIILPNARNGIKHLESKLAHADLRSAIASMRDVEVQVSLPKFKIETTIPLNEPLQELGLQRLFTQGQAEFPNMIESPEELYVSKVIQKAFLEVNEEGTVAAAATGVVIVAESLGPLPETFTVDHPFIILLRASSGSENILFYGRISNPNH